MNAPIFEQLAEHFTADLADEREHWQEWFGSHVHHQPQPYDEHQQPHQEEPMPLAATSDTLTARTGSLRTALQASATALHEALDQHVAGLIDDAAQVADAAATVENTPIIKSALGAAHVPTELLGPVAQLLDSLAAAHPKPAEPEPQPA